MGEGLSIGRKCPEMSTSDPMVRYNNVNRYKKLYGRKSKKLNFFIKQNSSNLFKLDSVLFSYFYCSDFDERFYEFPLPIKSSLVAAFAAVRL